ncbi:unnamed protein product [Mytilus coruscus]|uniref:Mutator-like transposase domain-containing protein n=1 Tax=Mytilus coruscus TaxID=42192 RepID=A0A6J8AFT2_MYTCO|nr:unnamed protein product [Mytilus coruscus]
MNLLGYVDTPLKVNTVCLSSTVRDHRLVFLVQHSSNPDTLQKRLTSFPRATGVTAFHKTLIKYFKKTPFEQSFEVEDHAADDDDDADESDNEMNITWEVNSNIENISDSNISSDDQKDASVTGCAFIQLEISQKNINQAVVCSTCKTGELNVIGTSENKKRGLCLKLTMTCKECNSNAMFDTDEKGNFEYSKIYNVNRLSVLAIRMMGKSRNALLKFCSILDLPSPMRISTVNYGFYKKHAETWKEIATEINEENLSEAAEEIQQLKRKSGWDGEGECKCSVSVDRSWAHVRYSSRFGFFVEDEKDCTLNHDGSSKTMEAQGAVILFRRSVEKHGLQYTTYVGDGDSSAYGNVVDSRPYGPNVIIAKEDCVGHIQGRMGKHLRRLVDQYKGRKLEDGKHIIGKGRLTNKFMNSFQTFYGMAIRNKKASEKGKKRRKHLKAMEAQHRDTLQYDDSYAKDKYYKSSTSNNPSEKGKRQPKCKTCGKPMKGQKKQTCQINQFK